MAKAMPIFNDFAMRSNYEIVGDGAMVQKENYFDNIFKSIALNNNSSANSKYDDYADEDEEELVMPQPREGKDIELGWDIAHMTPEDF
jgi:hypothetical protein